MRTLEIILDHLPYKELSPNSRCHWAEKARVFRIAKEELAWLAKSQWHDDKPIMRARVNYEFHLKGYRKHDADNLLASCKFAPDSLIDAGVIFYDDVAHLEIGSVKIILGDSEQTIIKIEELAG